MASAKRVTGQPRTVTVLCKKTNQFALGENGGLVTMVRLNPTEASQQWDMWMTSERDSDGKPAFCLVNKKNGKALAHTNNKGDYLFFKDFFPNLLTDNTLWSHSADNYSTYGACRNAVNTTLNMDVLGENVRESARVGTWTWNGGDHQNWKLPSLTAN